MDELRDQMDLLGLEEEGDWDDQEQEEDEEEEQAPERGEAGNHGVYDDDDGGLEDSGPDDLTCAICLGQIQPLDLALVKGCEHQYCVHCILQWAMHKAWCPQCKAPFTHLYTHRHLDGTPSDYPLEEGVTLLKRARWFTDELEARERAKEAALGARRLAAADAERRAAAAAAADDGTDRYHSVDGDGPAPPSPRDWCDLYEDMVDAELEEDEAIEDYYFSSAAGRARIVLGNRRWGGGGFMRNGRMYARPVGAGGASGSGAGGAAAGTSAAAAAAPAGGKGKGKAAASSPAAPAPATPSPADGKGKGRVLPAAPAPMPSSNGGRCKPASKEKIPKSAQAQYAWDRDAPASAALGASPLGRSPGSFGAGSCGGGAGAWMAAALGSSPGGAGVGSAPGSGRRAKRNARRAAADAGVALEF